MRSTYLLFFAFFTLMIFGACSNASNADGNVNYFDLESYIDLLKEEGTTKENVEKIVAVNGEKEKQILDSYDYRQELEMLRKYNINKASLAGKYSVDSLQEGDAKTIIYQALEDKLLTQSLSIKKVGKEINEIIIKGSQISLLSESNLTIIFEPENKYHLLSEDNNKYSKDLVKEIIINFII